MIVYTTVFGRTDPLHEPEVTGNNRFICYTDQPIQSDVWEIIRIPTQNRPTKASRLLKVDPMFDEPYLWVDANFILKVDPETLLDNHPEDAVNFVHRDRKRIVEEAKECIRIKKSLPEQTIRQVEAYQAEGFDTNENPMTVLSCNGMFLRRPTEMVSKFNALWAEQIRNHTNRDQLSADYCAWKVGLTLGKFPGWFDTNPYADYRRYQRPVNDY